MTDEVPQTPEDDPEFWPIWTTLIAREAGTVDVVFTSEHYGDELARRVNAQHVCVDRARVMVAVSGTAIRADPMAAWDFIPPSVRPYFVRRIAVVGAESTGKTTLAQRLATELGTAWVPEFGRAYCERRDARDLTLADFDAIAKGQIALEDEAATRASRVLICDTELHTTCTWSDLIAGARPAWLTDAAAAREYELFLLLEPDVPWTQDGTRVLGNQRADHTARLQAELTAAGRRVLVIGGSYDERYVRALRAARALG